jgi:hypothetical protein
MFGCTAAPMVISDAHDLSGRMPGIGRECMDSRLCECDPDLKRTTAAAPMASEPIARAGTHVPPSDLPTPAFASN